MEAKKLAEEIGLSKEIFESLVLVRREDGQRRGDRWDREVFVHCFESEDVILGMIRLDYYPEDRGYSGTCDPDPAFENWCYRNGSDDLRVTREDIEGARKELSTLRENFLRYSF